MAVFIKIRIFRVVPSLNLKGFEKDWASIPFNFIYELNTGVAPIKPDTALIYLRTPDTPSAISSSTLYEDGRYCNPQTMWVAAPSRSLHHVTG